MRLGFLGGLGLRRDLPSSCLWPFRSATAPRLLLRLGALLALALFTLAALFCRRD